MVEVGGAETCRVDLWLWRARLTETRSLASTLAAEGRIRLTRDGAQTRLDKASRTVRPGDELVFALAGRITAVRVLELGLRRGPPAEARALYEAVPAPGDAAAAGPTAVSPSRGGIDKP